MATATHAFAPADCLPAAVHVSRAAARARRSGKRVGEDRSMVEPQSRATHPRSRRARTGQRESVHGVDGRTSGPVCTAGQQEFLAVPPASTHARGCALALVTCAFRRAPFARQDLTDPPPPSTSPLAQIGEPVSESEPRARTFFSLLQRLRVRDAYRPHHGRDSELVASGRPSVVGRSASGYRAKARQRCRESGFRCLPSAGSPGHRCSRS
jgi:hypothetical protein